MTAGREAAASLRCFVALDVESTVRARLAGLAAELLPALPRLRLVQPEGIHLTLRFLGASAPAQIERLGPALARAAAEGSPGTLRLAGLGTFPARGSPRVLHVAVEGDANLTALQAACEAAARAAGYAREDRAFHPHLTLGRWRDRVPRPTLPDVALPDSLRVSTLTLFRSQTRPGGAEYTALRTFELGGTAAG